MEIGVALNTVRTNAWESGSADFAALVRGHQAMVFSIAYHFLQDRSQAEDIAQDVFLQLHQNLGKLGSAAHIRFWLRKVTSQRCIDHARRFGLRPTVPLDNAPEPATPPTPGDPLLRERLRQLVATLPRKPRLVMILRYQEDLDPEEIAEMLNMPVRTVKSYLHRSLALLRRKMQPSIREVRS